MAYFDKLLVGLNLTTQDAAPLRYTVYLNTLGLAKEIHFVHAFEMGEEREEIASVDSVFRADRGPRPVTVTMAQEQIIERGRDHFGTHPGPVSAYIVEKGPPLDVLLRVALRRNVDLVIMGRKDDRSNSNLLTEKMIRKAPCSVLIIPKETQPTIKNVLVPVDFSEHSRAALDVAVAVAKASGLRDVKVLYVYPALAEHPYKASMSFEEYVLIMKQYAEKRIETFLARQELQGLNVTSLLIAGNNRPCDAIAQTIWMQEVDLIVMGTRGRTASTALLLDSVTEQLIWKTEVPLLAVKRKGSNTRPLDF